LALPQRTTHFRALLQEYVTVVSALLTTIVGAAIGLSCNVFVLLMVTMLAAFATSLGSLWNGLSVAATLGSAVVVWACLQGGYMIGLTARDVFSQLVARLKGTQLRRI
jgi:hypothetical protein